MPTEIGCSSRRGPSSSTEECTKDIEPQEGKDMCRKGYLGLQKFSIWVCCSGAWD